MKEKVKRIAGYGLVVAALIALDQAVKEWVCLNLRGQPPIVWIPEVFELTYLENKGAAFGIFNGWNWLFYLLTPLSLGLIGYILYRIPKEPRFRIPRWCCLLIMAGAVGNFLDRIFRGFVVDMFYFKLINFAVFKVADAYVVVGIFVLAPLIIFWKDLSLAMFTDGPKSQKQEEEHG